MKICHLSLSFFVTVPFSYIILPSLDLSAWLSYFCKVATVYSPGMCGFTVFSGKISNYFVLKIPRCFPAGAVVENPPANAGDTGSIPGLGRSHMPWSNEARAPQLLSLCSRAREPQLLSLRATTTEACVPRARAPQLEKPLQWEARTPQRRVAPTHRN